MNTHQKMFSDEDLAKPASDFFTKTQWQRLTRYFEQQGGPIGDIFKKTMTASGVMVLFIVFNGLSKDTREIVIKFQHVFRKNLLLPRSFDNIVFKKYRKLCTNGEYVLKCKDCDFISYMAYTLEHMAFVHDRHFGFGLKTISETKATNADTNKGHNCIFQCPTSKSRHLFRDHFTSLDKCRYKPLDVLFNNPELPLAECYKNYLSHLEKDNGKLYTVDTCKHEKQIENGVFCLCINFSLLFYQQFHKEIYELLDSVNLTNRRDGRFEAIGYIRPTKLENPEGDDVVASKQTRYQKQRKNTRKSNIFHEFEKRIVKIYIDFFEKITDDKAVLNEAIPPVVDLTDDEELNTKQTNRSRIGTQDQAVMLLPGTTAAAAPDTDIGRSRPIDGITDTVRRASAWASTMTVQSQPQKTVDKGVVNEAIPPVVDITDDEELNTKQTNRSSTYTQDEAEMPLPGTAAAVAPDIDIGRSRPIDGITDTLHSASAWASSMTVQSQPQFIYQVAPGNASAVPLISFQNRPIYYIFVEDENEYDTRSTRTQIKDHNPSSDAVSTPPNNTNQTNRCNTPSSEIQKRISSLRPFNGTNEETPASNRKCINNPCSSQSEPEPSQSTATPSNSKDIRSETLLTTLARIVSEQPEAHANRSPNCIPGVSKVSDSVQKSDTQGTKRNDTISEIVIEVSDDDEIDNAEFDVLQNNMHTLPPPPPQQNRSPPLAAGPSGSHSRCSGPFSPVTPDPDVHASNTSDNVLDCSRQASREYNNSTRCSTESGLTADFNKRTIEQYAVPGCTSPIAANNLDDIMWAFYTASDANVNFDDIANHFENMTLAENDTGMQPYGTSSGAPDENPASPYNNVGGVGGVAVVSPELEDVSTISADENAVELENQSSGVVNEITITIPTAFNANLESPTNRDLVNETKENTDTFETATDILPEQSQPPPTPPPPPSPAQPLLSRENSTLYKPIKQVEDMMVPEYEIDMQPYKTTETDENTDTYERGTDILPQQSQPPPTPPPLPAAKAPDTAIGRSSPIDGITDTVRSASAWASSMTVQSHPQFIDQVSTSASMAAPGYASAVPLISFQNRPIYYVFVEDENEYDTGSTSTQIKNHNPSSDAVCTPPNNTSQTNRCNNPSSEIRKRISSLRVFNGANEETPASKRKCINNHCSSQSEPEPSHTTATPPNCKDISSETFPTTIARTLSEQPEAHSNRSPNCIPGVSIVSDSLQESDTQATERNDTISEVITEVSDVDVLQSSILMPPPPPPPPPRQYRSRTSPIAAKNRDNSIADELAYILSNQFEAEQVMGKHFKKRWGDHWTYNPLPEYSALLELLSLTKETEESIYIDRINSFLKLSMGFDDIFIAKKNVCREDAVDTASDANANFDDITNHVENMIVAENEIGMQPYGTSSGAPDESPASPYNNLGGVAVVSPELKDVSTISADENAVVLENASSGAASEITIAISTALNANLESRFNHDLVDETDENADTFETGTDIFPEQSQPPPTPPQLPEQPLVSREKSTDYGSSISADENAVDFENPSSGAANEITISIPTALNANLESPKNRELVDESDENTDTFETGTDILLEQSQPPPTPPPLPAHPSLVSSEKSTPYKLINHVEYMIDENDIDMQPYGTSSDAPDESPASPYNNVGGVGGVAVVSPELEDVSTISADENAVEFENPSSGVVNEITITIPTALNANLESPTNRDLVNETDENTDTFETGTDTLPEHSQPPPAPPEPLVSREKSTAIKNKLKLKNKSAIKKARLKATSYNSEKKEALKMFLLSLIPEVEPFNDDQIKLFKRRTLKVIDDISSQSTSSTPRTGLSNLGASGESNVWHAFS